VEFSRGYFDARLRSYQDGSAGFLLEATDSWFLACGPVLKNYEVSRLLGSDPREPHYAKVCLADWPFQLYSRWREWDDFVSYAYRGNLIGAAVDAVDEVMALVRVLAPTFEGIVRLRAQRLAGPSR
jgi:hypothetical protein